MRRCIHILKDGAAVIGVQTESPSGIGSISHVDHRFVVSIHIDFDGGSDSVELDVVGRARSKVTLHLPDGAIPFQIKESNTSKVRIELKHIAGNTVAAEDESSRPVGSILMDGHIPFQDEIIPFGGGHAEGIVFSSTPSHHPLQVRKPLSPVRSPSFKIALQPAHPYIL